MLIHRGLAVSYENHLLGLVSYTPYQIIKNEISKIKKTAKKIKKIFEDFFPKLYKLL